MPTRPSRSTFSLRSDALRSDEPRSRRVEACERTPRSGQLAALGVALMLLGCHNQGPGVIVAPAQGSSSSHGNNPALSRSAGEGGAHAPQTSRGLALPTKFETGWRLAFEAWSGEAAGSLPRPEPLSVQEWQQVVEGWTVTRPFDFELGGHRYVGGAAYQLIAADSDAILAALTDAEQLPLALPLTQEARQVEGAGQLPQDEWRAREWGANAMSSRAGLAPTEVAVELHQGNSLLKARYTLRLRQEDEHAIKFTLDTQRPHDIRDARGYFTADQMSETHSLVTVFVGVDLGGGIAQAFFKGPVQRAALAAPAHLRRYLEPLAQRDRVARAAAAEQMRSRERSTVAASN